MQQGDMGIAQDPEHRLAFVAVDRIIANTVTSAIGPPAADHTVAPLPMKRNSFADPATHDAVSDLPDDE